MQLDPDCIRDILLTVEEKSAYGEFVRLPDNDSERLKKYDKNKILYHVRQCHLAGYFYNVDDDLLNFYLITDLSPAGHEFVGKVRDEKNWKIVKSGLSAVRGYSLDAIRAVADGAVNALISSFIKSQGL